MKKIKNQNLLYIFSIIFTLYFLYLIHNAYTISIREVWGLFSIILVLAFLGIWIFNKNIDITNINQKSIKKIFIISMMISVMIIMLNYDFFTKKFTNSQIKIMVLNSKNEYSLDNEISIENINVDNMPIRLSNIKLDEGWKYENNKITNEKNRISELSINFSKCKDIKITFSKNEKSGKIKVIDGNNEEILDLYSYKDDIGEYKIKSNSHIDMLYIVRLVCSYVMILFITSLIILASYYMYKDKKSIILPTIMLILVLRCFYYSNLQQYTLYPDSESYIVYNFTELLNLQIPARTPVYPFIIEVCEKILGSINFVVIFQIILSFVAVIYFYKTLRLIIKNERIIALITVFYGGTMAICGWDNCILTESCAISGFVFFIYNIIKYIKYPNTKNGILAVVISLILTFLRPTSIILLVMLFIFWIVRFILDRKDVKKDIVCFIGSLISVIIVIVYSVIFYNTHQIYSISDPTIRQDLFICINEGFYKSSNNKQFIEDIEKEKENVEKLCQNIKVTEIDKTWLIERKIQEIYGNKQIQELTAYCKKQNIREYMSYIIKLVKNNSDKYYEGYSIIINKNSKLMDILTNTFQTVNFAYVYIMIIGELCVGLFLWIKNKNIPWIHMGIFAFSFAIVSSTFIGTNDEFMRTSIAVLPFFYISISILVEYIYNKLIIEEAKKVDFCRLKK